MKVLHVACIDNSPFKGVCVAVPQYVRSQQGKNEVALLNINTCRIDGIVNSFIFDNRSYRSSVSEEFQKPDIVVFHEVYHFTFIIISLELRNSHVPYVIVPHGCLVTAAQNKKWLKKKLANLLFFNSFIDRAEAIQCLSQQEIDNTKFMVKKFLCSNGVNYPAVCNKHFSARGVSLTYIGRLDIYVKGIDILIDSVRLVAAFLRKEKVIIDIYGPDILGSFNKIDALIKENGVNDIIHLHHEISGREKEFVLDNTDIFIQTSRHEGMPMGILEAMGMGVPCLVTVGTSLGGIIASYEAGWVAENNVESVAKTIQRAVSDRKHLINFSKNARKLVIDNFAWDKISYLAIESYKAYI